MGKNKKSGWVRSIQELERAKETWPAEILQSQSVHPDPAHAWRGAPPQIGVVTPPHIATMGGWIGSQARTYPNEDEATRDSRINGEMMRRDGVIAECLKARQRAVALLPWHLVPEDEQDPRQKSLVADLTSILERTRRFTELRRNLMEAIWYGKSCVALKYWPVRVRGQWRKVVTDWEPRHADKLVFRYSDGTNRYMQGQVGIRVNYMSRNLNRDQIEPTQYGLAYFLREFERRCVIVHKHEVEDAPYEDVYAAGRIHGVGVRDTVYWLWYAAKEVEQKLLEYLDRTALGIEIWRYPSGNTKAEAAARKAAMERIGGGRSIVLVPVIPGEQAELFGVQHIEPGPAGAELLNNICQEFYGHRIKRIILGQTLTSEAESTGMGSGVADAHMATFSDIVRYDAVNLEETITEDYVQVCKEENFPWAHSVYIRYKLNTERPETEQKLAAYQAAWNMGLKVRAEDIYALIGARRPDEEDDVLQNPNIMMAEQQQAMMMAQAGMPPGGAPGDAQGSGTTVFPPMGQAGAALDQMGAQDPSVQAGAPPTASAELDRQAASEPGPVLTNPWAGFWDSLFAAARGVGVQPPVAPQSSNPIVHQGSTPPVTRAQLAQIFQERFDQAIRIRGQTAQQFREALESALAEQPDGPDLATTMQFLFAWKTAKPAGKLKAQLTSELRKPSGNGVHREADVQSVVNTEPVKQELRTNLVAGHLEAALDGPPDPVKAAFRDAFDRQTQVRDQLLKALRETGLTEPEPYTLRMGTRDSSTAEDPVSPQDPQAVAEPLVEAVSPALQRVDHTADLDPETALARYRAGTMTSEELDRYALEESLAGAT